MEYFFRMSAIISVLSLMVLAFQQVGTLNFLITLIAFVCCVLVATVSGIIIYKRNKR